jgi:hypothetical protein
MADRIKKPLQIPEYSGLIPLDRDNALVPAFLSSSRLIIRETIKQTGL